MKQKIYILTFDRDGEGVDYSELHNKIISMPEIIDWFHYIKSSYIIVTNVENATYLNDKLFEIFTIRYLLVEVKLANSNGRLPKQGWEWIMTKY